MSIKIIQDKLDQYKPQNQLEEENALKEIAQEIALSALSRAGFFKVAAFQGGTCLRILYGLNRFSDDLDFALNEPDPSFKWAPYLKNLQTELEVYGFQFKIEDRDKDTSVKSVFLKDDSIGNILILNHRNQGKSKMIKIKLEIDTTPPLGAKNEQKTINFPVTVPVISHDLPSLIAGKSHALLCRDVAKGRDWFDFIWYAGGKTPINFDLLTKAIKQYGPWKNQKIQVDKKWYSENLSVKIERTDWKKQKKDVERFLKANDLDLLRQWGTAFFLDRLAVLIPQYIVDVCIVTKDGKMKRYPHENCFYYEKDEAIAIAKMAFVNTADVIMVEVFQSGIARPVAFFQ